MLQLAEHLVAYVDRFGCVAGALVDRLLGTFRGEARGDCVEHVVGVLLVVEMVVRGKEGKMGARSLYTRKHLQNFLSMAETNAVSQTALIRFPCSTHIHGQRLARPALL